MKHKIQDKKLHKILTERSKVVKESRKLYKKKEEVEKELQKLGYKMNRLKDKTVPFIEKHRPNLNLTEFSYIARTMLEGGEVIIEVRDQVDDYIELLREKRDEDNSPDSNNKK